MQTRTILFDAHVHIYPQYDMNTALNHSIMNFSKIIQKHHLPENTVPVWLLTEGEKYNFFTQPLSINDYRIIKGDEKESLILVNATSGEPVLYILAGRQIVSSDKLEVCALATTATIADRQLNTQDAIAWVRDQGGVPALNWAPGKWFFARGKVVRNVIENNSPNSLLISETTMRPTIWPTPSLMKNAIHKGFRIVAGSDPLPLTGEEKLLASYAGVMTGPFNPERPAQSLKNLLLYSGTEITRLGKRSGPITFAQRQYGIMKYNKTNK